MKEIRTIIVDDEPLARRGLSQLIESHTDLKIIAEARNGVEAIASVRDLKPDLMFLDVQMPEPDGFGVIKQILSDDMPLVVFVTAYDDFAVRAFDAHAVDYLVKPLQQSRFDDAVDRVRNRIRSREALLMSDRLALLLEEQNSSSGSRRVVVQTSSGELLLDVAVIDWIEAEDYYAAVHVGQRRYLIRESLASLEHRLDGDCFVRTHRSAIVNMDRVSELRMESGEMVLLLQNGQRVPVSRRRRECVRNHVRRFK